MRTRGRPPHPGVLTPRQEEVLTLIREGLTNEQIAERLGVSFNAAKFHVSEVIGRLGVDNRYEAAAWRPTLRPWWAAAFAPFGFVRRAFATKAATVTTAGTVIGVATVAAAGLAIGVATPFGASQQDAAGAGASEGRIAYLSVAPAGLQTATIRIMNPDGSGDRPLTSGQQASWSPDGKRLVFSDGLDDQRALYLINADGTGRTLLTRPGTLDKTPAWSPDGALIAFDSYREGRWDAYAVRPDGTGLRQLTSGGVETRHPSWSPDGKQLAFTRESQPQPGSPWLTADVYIVGVDGTGERKLTNTGSAGLASWSPDGRTIAFGRGLGQPGSPDGYVTVIFLIDASGRNERQVTDPSLGILHAFFPRWSPDGKRLVFSAKTHSACADAPADVPCDAHGPGYDIYTLDLDTSRMTRLTDQPGHDGNPDWSRH